MSPSDLFIKNGKRNFFKQIRLDKRGNNGESGRKIGKWKMLTFRYIYNRLFFSFKLHKSYFIIEMKIITLSYIQENIFRM